MFSDGKKSVVKEWDAKDRGSILFNASGTSLFRTQKNHLEVIDILLGNSRILDSGQHFYPIAIAGKSNDKLVVGKDSDTGLNIWASKKEDGLSNIHFPLDY